MTAEMTSEPGREKPRTMEADFAMLNGVIRVEVQTSQVLGEQGVPGSAESLKRLGMERQVHLIQPEDQTIYLLYPGLKGYIEVPFPRNERGLKPEQIQVQKQKAGEETVAGHPCIKNEVTLTHPNGVERHALVWQATDLAQFPIRIELEHRGAALQLNYRKITFRRPDREQFRVPSGYKKHEDMQALTRVALQKLYGGNGLQDVLPQK
jgi:hypothetical protein